MNDNVLQWISTLGGSFFSIFSLFPITDVFRTVVLGIIGTIVSYLVTLLLQKMRK